MAALETSLEAQRTALEASIDLLRETLEQHIADLEVAGVDAPPSRLLIVPLKQTAHRNLADSEAALLIPMTWMACAQSPSSYGGVP